MTDPPAPASTGPHSATAPRTLHSQTGGGLLTLLGVGLVLLALYDTQFQIPWPMPRSWYTNQSLWVTLAVVLAGCGLWLQRQPAHRLTTPGLPVGWAPARPGQRFQNLVLLTRPGCHLCEDAQEILADYAEFLPELEEVNIDQDPDLKSVYWDQIPVVRIDGIDRFRGRIDEHLLRRLIEGSPPVT